MEIDDYDYATTQRKASSDASKMIGHFTQVVWKNSTEVGVGIAYGKKSSGENAVFIVARYKPQGNYNLMNFGETAVEGRLRNWGENVLPQQSGRCCILHLLISSSYIRNSCFPSVRALHLGSSSKILFVEFNAFGTPFSPFRERLSS